MEKKQQNRGGGIVFYIILAAIIGIIVFSVRSFNKKGDDYSYSQFVQDLNNGIVSCVTIKQNEQAPTGKITVDFSQQGKESVSTFVTDVTMVEKVVTEYNSKNDQRVELDTKDITKESVFLTTVLPFILVAVSIIVVFVLLGRSSGGGGANAKMMNFGKSRARLMDPSAAKVTFDKVAGLSEEKEELEEIVDFLKNPAKYVELGARIPKGVILVGPPGTGKTSIAKSVAEALNKKYVRICLGGVRDEAEIRGHRKTYVGAMPGRITEALSQAGVSNPLMLLDEIDKTSSDYKGDTSAALLEVLDPEQNNRFNDHYVEVPQDLSEVLFIATANDMDSIPRPLLDRMEVIEISGYTENEKEHIAKEHLIPKQLEVNGIPKGALTIQPSALRKIITLYTREAGVRGLERKIGQICRKAAREIMENNQKKITVKGKNLEDFLGKARYSYLMANKKDEVGIARGLAWTQVGGDTLQIEVNVMPGKGELVLTGQLGDVMKESAQAGISYIRSVASDYDISPEFFQENDIHVHIPEGAVPKDGPSAGITMATAMLSAIIGREVRADVAMTGEITLRGHVLPIGGLKEKLLAAKYAKIRQVLVPKQNKPDIQEMDDEILDGLKISFVENMNEVLHEALAN